MQKKIPAWAPSQRRWPKGFTAHRDGWIKSYRGKTIWVGGKTVDVADLPKLFEAKTKIADAKPLDELPTAVGLTYAELLGAFLAYKEHEVAQGRISSRTLHNYEYHLNEFGKMIGGGRRIAADIGPRDFTIVRRNFDRLSKMTIESNMAYITAMFKWAEGMELIGKFRPGPEWRRPMRREIQAERLEFSKTFNPSEFAKLWTCAPDREKIWLGLGVCAGFTNSDIAHLPIEVIDYENNRIDFARRKTGKVRRIAVLPPYIMSLMRDYKRPRPVDEKFGGLFFIGRDGIPLNYANGRQNTNSVSVAFNRLQQAAGVVKPRRGFTGMRTTFFNLCPAEYTFERSIIMGRARGTIDNDHYLETMPIERIRACIAHVWSSISSELGDETRTA